MQMVYVDAAAGRWVSGGEVYKSDIHY